MALAALREMSVVERGERDDRFWDEAAGVLFKNVVRNFVSMGQGLARSCRSRLGGRPTGNLSESKSAMGLKE